MALGYGAIALAAGAEARADRSIAVEPRPLERAERVVLHPHAERLARRFGIGDDLAALIYKEARLADVEPGMAFGMIATESGFDPAAVGRQGERGLMQIKPSTARAYDARVTPGALHDPELNVRLGLRHLKREVEFFGDRSLGLMSYHMGRARLKRELADGVPPRNRYVDRVLSSCGSDCG
ncbi:MAG TPA: transglycosylase SLT domain-containing protein [Gemmatimonadota bacterium]|nr:transglycosylase SLT domain-containing protein [Gemmatimonadota bacterium]